MKCASDGGCIAQNATDCGNGTSCPVGRICSGTECTIRYEPPPRHDEFAFTIPVPENKLEALAIGTLIAIVVSVIVGKLVSSVFPGERTHLQQRILAGTISQMISGIFLWYFGFVRDWTLFTVPVAFGILSIAFLFTPSDVHHT
jgi:hypothetical protein